MATALAQMDWWAVECDASADGGKRRSQSERLTGRAVECESSLGGEQSHSYASKMYAFREWRSVESAA